jgi:hypothetical protein
MGIRVECDWCRQTIPAGAPYATVEIDGKIDGKGGQLATSVAAPARVYCGRGPDSCGRRVLGVLEGNPVGRADMGFEWQLVPVEAWPPHAKEEPTPRVPAARNFDPAETVTFDGVQVTAELHEFICSHVSSSYKYALPRAGIVSIDQAAAMSDEELLALRGIGWRIVKELRKWIAARGVHDGLTLAREIYELIVDRLPQIDESDALHPMLANAMPPLAEALGMEMAS